MDFGLLGPLEIDHLPGTIVGSRKTRGLLSVLALQSGATVSIDEIRAALWGDFAPRTSHKAIQGYVSHLRRQLGASALLTRGNGYQLNVPGAVVDVQLFENGITHGRSLLMAGQLGDAAGAIGAALGLWRGIPLQELDDHSFRLNAVTRLGELRAAALEDRHHALLGSGEHHALIPELRAAATAEPLREQRWAQLMLALHRCGRQAEALRAFQDLRSYLGHELGVLPSVELRDLEQAIAREDPALRPDRDRPAIAPAPRVGRREQLPLPPALTRTVPIAFVGRAKELDVLGARLARVSAGFSQVVVVSGEAGAGKSALVAETARAAHAGDAVVLHGRTDPELAIPNQPFVEAFGHYARRAPDAWLASHDPRWLAELWPLAPGLRRRLPDLGPPTASDSDAARPLLMRAAIELTREISDRGPLLLILEDLQWADRSTLALVALLVRSGIERLLLVLTFRPEEGAPTSALGEMLLALRRDAPPTELALAPLTDEAAVSLLQAAVGQPLDDEAQSMARALRRDTDGNAFLLTEMALHLVETGVLQPGPDGLGTILVRPDERSLPERVRQVLESRVARLSRDCRQMLATAAVLGAEVDVDLLAATLAADEDQLLDLLEQAEAASLMFELADKPGTFRFAHVLVQEALYQGIGATRRSRWHRRAAIALQAQIGIDPRDRSRSLARHHRGAGRPADLVRAVPYEREAGDHARLAFAPDEALRWYDLADEGLELADDPMERARILVGRGEAERQLSVGDYRRTLRDAAAAGARADAPEVVVRAALAGYRGLPNMPGDVDLEQVALLEAALAHEQADTPSRARLLATLGHELGYEDRYERRLGLIDEAIAVARRCDDAPALLDALVRPFQLGFVPELADDFRARIAEAIELTALVNDPVMRFLAHKTRAALSVEHGHIDGVDEDLAIAHQIAEELGQPRLEWLVSCNQAWRVFLAGDVDRAESLTDEALATGMASGEPDAMLAYAVNLFMVRHHQGRAGELLPLMQEALASFPGLRGIESGLAMAAFQAGVHDLAGELLEEAARGGFDLPHDVAWLTGMWTWGEVAADLGDESAAHHLIPILAPWRQRLPMGGAAVSHAVSHTLGRLRLVVGQLDQAQADFGEALVIHERLGATHFAEMTRRELDQLGSDPPAVPLTAVD